MSLIEIIVTIALVGLICWGVTTLVPMPTIFSNAIYVIAVVGLVLYLLSALGLMPRFMNIRIGR